MASRLRWALPDIGNWRQRVDGLLRAASLQMAQALAQRRERASALALRLRALDPRNTLARGYAIVQHRNQRRVVTSVGQVKGRDRLDICVQDGHFPAEVSRQYGF